MLYGSKFFTVTKSKRPCDFGGVLGFQVSCLDFSDPEKFPPVVTRTALDVRQLPESNILCWIAKRYQCTRLYSAQGFEAYYESIEVEIAEGVTLGFNFFKPDKTPDSSEQRHINLQFLIKESNSQSDALRALKAFLSYLEAAPQNPVQVVFFKYGPIDSSLIGRDVVTTSREKLEKAYKRLLNPQKISNTEYYQIEFTPKYPKSVESVIKQSVEV